MNTVNPHEPGGKMWIDPAFWERISVGYCDKCHEGHVLKDGVCWNCREETK
jgi:hypothetical protein